MLLSNQQCITTEKFQHLFIYLFYLSFPLKAVQHERAPRGVLKRSYPPDFIPTTPAAAVASATPFLSTSHPPTSSPSISVGQHFYSGHFTLPWRPALANVHSLHHVMPRHFPPLTVLIPPSSLHSDSRHTVSLSNNINSQPLKDDEVSSSAKEETLMSETRNTGNVCIKLLHVKLLKNAKYVQHS